jgi:hypothetical protein
MFPFPSPLLMGQAVPLIIDGTQGSANAGILAAVYFTVSGTTPTIVGQKNVASITRNGQGKYRITYTSALANNNYGFIAGAQWAAVAGDNNTPLVVPCRNSTSGFNTYSTTAVDIAVTDAIGQLFDPGLCGIIIFDPSAVGSDYLAACSVTVSGTTPTLQRQTNVSSAPRQATGVYRPTFTSALANANYSVFGSSRYADFTNDASAFFSQSRTTARATGSDDLNVGTIAQTGGTVGNFEPGRFSMLARNSDTSPRGTLAGAQFTVSAGVVTLVKSWNVASITRSATGLFRLNYANALSDTDYVVMASGKFATSGTTQDSPLIGMNRNSTGPLNLHSVNSVDLVCRSWGASGLPFDPELADVWVVKPWLM